MTNKPQHTPEPWADELHAQERQVNKGDYSYIAEIRCIHNGGALVAKAHGNSSGSAEANARRIAACVNACAGLPTDKPILVKIRTPRTAEIFVEPNGLSAFASDYYAMVFLSAQMEEEVTRLRRQIERDGFSFYASDFNEALHEIAGLRDHLAQCRDLLRVATDDVQSAKNEIKRITDLHRALMADKDKQYDELIAAHSESERLRAGWIEADKIALEGRIKSSSREKGICENCGEPMPRGCEGIFRKDGSKCRLDPRVPSVALCACTGACKGYKSLPAGKVCALHVPQT